MEPNSDARKYGTELTYGSQKILAHLTGSPGSSIFGRRADDGTPFTLLDTPIIQTKVDSLPLVPRRTVYELVDAGYLYDQTGTEESVNVSFVLSEKLRTLTRK